MIVTKALTMDCTATISHLLFTLGQRFKASVLVDFDGTITIKARPRDMEKILTGINKYNEKG